MGEAFEGHAGELILAALEPFASRELFTLSGGHIFSLYDAALKRGWKLIDVRHEQTAGFAAEGMAKLTRKVGVAALTAGPGVTNGVSATTTAWFNGSPLVVIGGRAATLGWGKGALQEFDHVPVFDAITKRSFTAASIDTMTSDIAGAAALALSPHRGPVFVDVPIDVVYAQGRAGAGSVAPSSVAHDSDEVARAAALLAGAERPAIIAGTDVYFGEAWNALQAAVEALDVPCYVNGLGRGCLPADHRLAFSATRGVLKKEADVVCVIGTPLDFRVAFGSYGDATLIHIVDHPARRATHVAAAVSPAGDIAAILAELAEYPGPRADHSAWISSLRDRERAAAAGDDALLSATTDPIKPTRIYGELRKMLDRDAVVVCDGGDFVSYAGKYLDSYVPGAWLDPGPYGCLGTGMGYAIAARLAHPTRQVVVMMGDGAAGFSLMDIDTLVRHKLPVVIVVGNNSCWALEKNPMKMIYGYHVAAELQPNTRYDQIVSALGGAGEVVTKPGDIAPALKRAFAAGVPYLVNVMTDPDDVYPRQSSLG